MDARFDFAAADIGTWAGQPDTRVAITGASGWIGMTLAHICEALGLTQDTGRLRLFGSGARQLVSGERRFAIEDLFDAAPLGSGEWLVFHLAFLGKEQTEDLSPEAFETTNDAILARTLALVETAEKARLLFSSSGAVYGPDRNLVDASGNAYGYMKVRHEARVRDWAAARGTPLATCRIFNIGGPFINKQSRYALSDFIEQVSRNGRISIGATKPVFRSFVHVEELCQVLFSSLIDPALQFRCFDTLGREVLEIADLARTIGRVLGAGDIAIDRPALTPASPPDWYVGDGKDYQALLASCGRPAVDIEDIIRDTAQFMGHPVGA